MSTLRLLTLALAGALLVAACGEDAGDDVVAGTDADLTVDYPMGAENLVVRVELVGGFEVGPAAESQPLVSVYGDGTTIVPGPMIEIYPPPALPNLLTTNIGADGVEDLLRRAGALGLLASVDYGEPSVTDQPETVVTIAANGEVYEHRAYALDFEPGSGDDVTPEQRAARQRLARFVAVATGTDTLGDDALGPYHYGELAVLSDDYTPPEVKRPRPNTLAWPLDDLATAGDRFELGGRCLVVGGDDLDTVVDLAERATTITRWTSEGGSYSLSFVPLLPDEHRCDDLLPR